MPKWRILFSSESAELIDWKELRTAFSPVMYSSQSSDVLALREPMLPAPPMPNRRGAALILERRLELCFVLGRDH
jgi:hypothetical protein